MDRQEADARGQVAGTLHARGEDPEVCPSPCGPIGLKDEPLPRVSELVAVAFPLGIVLDGDARQGFDQLCGIRQLADGCQRCKAVLLSLEMGGN